MPVPDYQSLMAPVLGALADGGEADVPVGAENLCHQAIFMNHVSGAVAPPDAGVVQVGDAIGQRAERRGPVQGAVRPVRVTGCPGPRTSERWPPPVPPRLGMGCPAVNRFALGVPVRYFRYAARGSHHPDIQGPGHTVS